MTQEQRDKARDAREFVTELYRVALAGVGLKFRGIQEGMPERKLEPRILFDGFHQDTLALTVSEFTAELALVRAKDSDRRFQEAK